MNSSNPYYIVRSVDRALELLLIIGRKGAESGITELSKELGVTKSTVHSLLQTMMSRGFIEQNQENGKYRLGIALFELGICCAEKMDIMRIAKPFMESLSEETGEIVLLALPDPDGLVLVDKIEPQRPFLMIPRIDFRIALHSTAVGKVLLAFADEDWQDTVISKGLHSYTNHTIVDERSLHLELQRIRANGYGIGCNETIEGITCIAVPIYDYTNKVIAALSISSLSSVVTEDRYQEIILLLKQKATSISQCLGYKK